MFAFTVPPMSDVPQQPGDGLGLMHHQVIVPHVSLRPLFNMVSHFEEMDGELGLVRRWRLKGVDFRSAGRSMEVVSPGVSDARLIADVQDLLGEQNHAVKPLLTIPPAEWREWMEPNDALRRFQQVIEQLGGNRGQVPGVDYEGNPFNEIAWGRDSSVDYWDEKLFDNANLAQQVTGVRDQQQQVVPVRVDVDEIRGLAGGPWRVSFDAVGHWQGDEFKLKQVGFLTLAEVRVDGLAVAIGLDIANVIDRSVFDGNPDLADVAGLETLPALPFADTVTYGDVGWVNRPTSVLRLDELPPPITARSSFSSPGWGGPAA